MLTYRIAASLDAREPENNAEPRPVEQAGLGLLTAMLSSRATPPWILPRQNRPHGPIERRQRTKPHPSRDRSRKPATPANISIYQVVDRAVKRPNNGKSFPVRGCECGQATPHSPRAAR